MSGSVEETIRLRAVVNEWISQTFPRHRRFLSHSHPVNAEGKWQTALVAKNINGHSVELATIEIDGDGVTSNESADAIAARVDDLVSIAPGGEQRTHLRSRGCDFLLGDGIEGAVSLSDREIDLLLTDPPYGISKPYTCEGQVPRRLRSDGRDFIMPKGDFGAWDMPVEPREWLDVLLPKVGGWVVTFCAQAQIGEYAACLTDHKFVAVGTLVWRKTNPVPFNHRFKPINAWEAVVVGKRPGTKFNGNVVHNVFVTKSPSPQQRIHRTQKPLDLMDRFVTLFSGPGDLVYDPFAGAATTFIAARALGRRAIAYELDAKIFNAACGRIEGSLV